MRVAVINPVVACTRCERCERDCAGPCRCLADPEEKRIDITLHQSRRYCPLAKYGAGSDAKPAGWDELPEAEMPPAPVPGEAPDDWSSRGPAMWAELHRRPLESQGSDAAWLEAFARRISCGNCREHWRSWVAANPPPDPLTFEWTFLAHRAVSERLGKPSPTLEEARAYWGFYRFPRPAPARACGEPAHFSNIFRSRSYSEVSTSTSARIWSNSARDTAPPAST